MKSALISTARWAAFAGLIGLAGCVYRVHGPGVTISAEPVPAPYADVYYDPVYYDAGWYSGPSLTGPFPWEFQSYCVESTAITAT